MGPQVDLDKEEEMGNNTVLNDAGKYTPNKQTPKTKNSKNLAREDTTLPFPLKKLVVTK